MTGITTALLATAPLIFAENTVTISNNGEGARSEVNVSTNTGNNTVCVNGKCTTSEGSAGKSTVCINGKCTTSEGDIQMEEGEAKVNIQNGKSEVKVQQGTSGTNNVEVKQKVEGVSDKADTEKKAEEASREEQAKVKEATFMELVREKLQFLRKLLTFQFLFGDK